MIFHVSFFFFGASCSWRSMVIIIFCNEMQFLSLTDKLFIAFSSSVGLILYFHVCSNCSSRTLGCSSAFVFKYLPGFSHILTTACVSVSMTILSLGIFHSRRCLVQSLCIVYNVICRKYTSFVLYALWCQFFLKVNMKNLLDLIEHGM